MDSQLRISERVARTGAHREERGESAFLTHGTEFPVTRREREYDAVRLQGMDRFEEIQAAITRLAPDEYRRLAEWFREFQQTRWDEQMDQDSASSRLDFLFREGENESAQAFSRNWPSK